MTNEAIIKDLTAAVARADAKSLEEIRVAYLGRKGIVTEQLRAVGELPATKRSAAGAAANRLRGVVEGLLSQRQEILDDEAATLAPIDVTTPGLAPRLGHHHPVALLLEDLTDLFWQMGYQVVGGPEVETEWYNFEALNIGPDHPARDTQDTFYLEGGNLPRTQTSGVQIRHMELNKHKLPIRMVSPGKVYRNEDEDARHSWIFHQIEGLVVDEGITLADLKGTLEAMLHGVLGEGTKLRLRPNYFPYTEPSVEMDATCVVCSGSGRVDKDNCKMCGGTGWLELGGAGMVHPQVLRNAGIDPEKYSGFAFGFGPERIAALKYGVDDVREFWRPNLNFLEQF
jgi:phenylalanyl-tRNA synthetase alpha chain